jgi:hypothetical protein
MRWGLFQISHSAGIHHTISMVALLSPSRARRNQPTQGQTNRSAPGVAAKPAERPSRNGERGDSASPPT